MAQQAKRSKIEVDKKESKQRRSDRWTFAYRKNDVTKMLHVSDIIKRMKYFWYKLRIERYMLLYTIGNTTERLFFKRSRRTNNMEAYRSYNDRSVSVGPVWPQNLVYYVETFLRNALQYRKIKVQQLREHAGVHLPPVLTDIVEGYEGVIIHEIKF